jgi:hypothetical protein
MTRIITPELNKKLKKEYTLRFFSVLFFSISIIFFIHTSFSFSSLILLNSYQKAYEINIKNDTRDISIQNEIIQKKLGNLSAISEKLKFNGSIPVEKIFQQIESASSNGLQIRAFEIYKQKDKIQITLRSVAKTKDDLLRFDKQMRSYKNFLNFNIPIESFTKQQDINFDVTFTYNEN